MTDKTTEKPAKKKNNGGRPKGKKSSKEAQRNSRDSRIVELAVKGVPKTEIAKITDTSRKQVYRILDKFKPVFTELENVHEYQDVKSQLFNASELKLLKSMMSQDKLDKASVNNLAYAFQQIFTAGRLERNQSTSNVSQSVQFSRPPLESKQFSNDPE